MLTLAQHRLLTAIHTGQQNTGVTPSFRELAVMVGIVSPSGVHRTLLELEERGYVRRIPHRHRAIQVLRLPPAYHGRVINPTSSELIVDMPESWK